MLKGMMTTYKRIVIKKGEIQIEPFLSTDVICTDESKRTKQIDLLNLVITNKLNHERNEIMNATQSLKFTAVSQPTLFTHDSMEYYLVEFKAKAGLDRSTHRDAKEAFDAAGHIPAKIRDVSIFNRKEFKKYKRLWITLYDCRENMNDRVGYFLGKHTRTAQRLGLANQKDGLCFYHMDHGGGPSEYPALAWRKVQ